MKSLSIVDLNFFQVDFVSIDKMEGSGPVPPIPLPGDFSSVVPFIAVPFLNGGLGFSVSSGNGNNSVSKSSSATAFASADDGRTSTFTTTI